MKRFITYLALAALLTTTIAGCQAVTGKTAGENIDDGTITTAVNATLVADKASNFTRIDVDTTRGVVSLNGTVENSAQKARAEQLARRVDGVKKVVNNLQTQSK